CFVSLLPRPLMFYVIRQFVAASDPEHAADFERLWAGAPDFRSTLWLITVVWGVCYAAEAALRVVLVLILPTATFLAVSSPLMLVVTAAVVLWTVAYARRARQRRERNAS